MYLPRHSAKLLALCLGLLVASIVTLSFTSAPPLLEREMSATVMVKLPDGHGSGVRVGKNLFLTAAHVTAGGSDFTIRTSDGVDHKAVLLWQAPERDVALLRTADDDTGYIAEMACRPVVLNEPITGIGNPIAARWHVAHGTVSSVQPIAIPDDAEDDPSNHAVPVDMNIAGGMSGGGPAFDADGRVLGLMEAVMLQKLSAFSASLTGVGMIVPADRICDLLAR